MVQVPVHDEVPDLVGHLGERCRITATAGVVDHDVDATEVFDRLIDEAIHTPIAR